MRKWSPGELFFWVLAAVAAVSLAFFLLVLSGAGPVASEDPLPATQPAAVPVVAAPAHDRPDAETSRVERQTETSSTTANAAREQSGQLVTVVVTANRGDCWVAARVGSASGRVLEERILRQGESVRLRAARIWLSLGASSNVDVVVDEQPREVPAGTVELLLTPRSST